MKRLVLGLVVAVALASNVQAQGSIARGDTVNGIFAAEILSDGGSFKFPPDYKGLVALRVLAGTSAVFYLDDTNQTATLIVRDAAGLFRAGAPPMSVYYEPSVKAFVVTNATGSLKLLSVTFL